MNLPSVLSAVAGAALVLVILWDAFETILVPRRIGRRVRLTRWFYVLAWRIWRALARRVEKPADREAMLGFFGPLSLLLLLGVWAIGLIVAFALLAMATHGPNEAPRAFTTWLYMSGETFFTLGFGDVTPATAAGRAIAVFEAGTGFGFLGTVVGYLPTMYGGFAQRELEISLMDARAGSPPTAAEFLRRTPPSENGRLRDDLLASWERWSAQLLETHISYPQLAYYRSQHTNQSWLAALVAILDSTALLLARGKEETTSQASLTFAMARHALVDVTQIFVHALPAEREDRLPTAAFRLLRERLESAPGALPDDPGFESRLAALRLRYEPYAQALAAHLLFELPPWTHEAPRRDNWQGGPWDKMLSSHREPAHRSEEHFG
ncbi:MAG: two pore domain potassium channel family protein [Candidatus Eisenbacteria bacterium]|uniref:Two pore domain potassium channel family protein n=1 Tax=Eiseniibacteriota bacterium TaxID=2212470 RepID=A0A933SD54_UNCEI|nr:two pore domain potassium channel family protein [Candidatus Eisenbacteria bacterium]